MVDSVVKAAPVPGLSGVPAARSRICDIDGSKGLLSYRGYSIEELAERSSFEETACLLLSGELPAREELASFESELVHHRRLKHKLLDLLALLPETGHPMQALGAGVAALGMFYPDQDVEDPRHRAEACVRLIAKLPTLVAAFHRIRSGDRALTPLDGLGHAANFLYLLSGKEPDPALARILDSCLVLHAEHSLNASTFSARVTASTLADSYAVVAAAVGTLSGPLHGGANEAVLRMLREIGEPSRVVPWLDRALADGRRIPGFGHREYKVKDPRARVLQGIAERLLGRSGPAQLYEVAVRLEAVMAERLGERGLFPNVEYYSGLVYERLGIRTDLFTPVFAVARVAGWVAHWLEQLEANSLFRPSQEYAGAGPRAYLPIEQRHASTGGS